MDMEDIQKTITSLEQRVESLEQKDQAAKAGDLQTPADVAQEAYEAAAADFQTERKDGMRLSLNSASTPAQVAALLRELDQEKTSDDAKP